MAELMPCYIEVIAEPRYWEDATVNGIPDEDGTLIPLRNGEAWNPIIRLADGVVMDWPQGTVADVHYKVCDAGEYWLLDEQRQRIAKWGGYYVPDDILCPGENGYGDYIILQIDGSGGISKWRAPRIEPDEWKHTEPRAKPEVPVAELAACPCCENGCNGCECCADDFADYDDDEDARDSPEFGCCLPPGECCMSGLHFPSECHTAANYERHQFGGWASDSAPRAKQEAQG